MYNDWVKLVKSAKSDDRSFEILVQRIEPLIRPIAMRMSKSYHISSDELIQDARIGIWTALRKIKLSRSKTIDYYLFISAINAMRANVKSLKRRSKCNVISYDDVDNKKLLPAVREHTQCQFRGVLLKYVKYIEQNGTFRGAHAYFAKKEGISRFTMCRRFNRAVDLFIKEMKNDDSGL